MSDMPERIGINQSAMAVSPTPSGSRFSLRSPREALQPVAAPAPPPRRKRKSGFLGRISGILSLAVVLSVVLGGAAMYIVTEVNSPGPLSTDKVVQIPKNSSGSEVVEQLTREGVVDHPSLMNAWIILKQPRLRAGEYAFKRASSIVDVLKVIEFGKPIVYKLTIPEGLTSEQIVDRVLENDVLTGEIKDFPREGSLLPDTYQFERGYTRDQIVKLMRQAQDKLVKEVWSRRSPDVPIRSPLELVTLASIVEKETGKAEERPRVAAVFINRLNRDMRLQTDPTVIYGIVGGRGTLGRGLTRAELDTPTPYNTYTIKGLPPGPIANPGRAALEAVANPLKTNELYFVADGTGGHAFAETRTQHERNVAKWRQIETQARDLPTQSPAPVPSLNGVSPPVLPVPQARGLSPQSPLPQIAPLPQPNSPGSPPTGTRSELPIQRAPRLAVTALPLPNQQYSLGQMPQLNIPGVSDVDEPGSAIAAENFSDTDAIGGPVESYPVPASRRTGGRSIASGLNGDAPRQDIASAGSLAVSQGEPGQPRPRAFDAVEGTAKDPLKNTTFDLNSPKDIPTLR